MIPTITPIYAALLALLLVWLSLRVIRVRRGAKVAIGSGGNAALERAQRAQANLTEYAPLTLLLIAFIEGMGAWSVIVHGFGIALVAGRIIHARGIIQEPETFRYRVIGMQLTINTLIGAALTAIALALWTGLSPSMSGL